MHLKLSKKIEKKDGLCQVVDLNLYRNWGKLWIWNMRKYKKTNKKKKLFQHIVNRWRDSQIVRGWASNEQWGITKKHWTASFGRNSAQIQVSKQLFILLYPMAPLASPFDKQYNGTKLFFRDRSKRGRNGKKLFQKFILWDASFMFFYNLS